MIPFWNKKSPDQFSYIGEDGKENRVKVVRLNFPQISETQVAKGMLKTAPENSQDSTGGTSMDRTDINQIEETKTISAEEKSAKKDKTPSNAKKIGLVAGSFVAGAAVSAVFCIFGLPKIKQFAAGGGDKGGSKKGFGF